MAQYRALVSFCGTISMNKGEVRELSDQTIIDDLLNAGYIESASVRDEELTYQDVIEDNYGTEVVTRSRKKST